MPLYPTCKSSNIIKLSLGNPSFALPNKKPKATVHLALGTDVTNDDRDAIVLDSAEQHIALEIERLSFHRCPREVGRFGMRNYIPIVVLAGLSNCLPRCGQRLGLRVSLGLGEIAVDLALHSQMSNTWVRTGVTTRS